ncbi:hypothetical protein FACS1894126_0730 [Alphaproteobacteria bacterium]|nr:hypothetical protein FACS1894126_0730 [Alphaproteobacteria bacterium]
MKKITMIALFSSLLEFVPSNATVRPPFAVDGFLDVERDTVLNMIKHMNTDDDDIKKIIGMSGECSRLKDNAFFKEIRQDVFPRPKSIKRVNQELHKYFSKDVYMDEYSIRDVLLLKWQKKHAFDWERDNEEEAELIKKMSPGERISICNDQAFEEFSDLKQIFYLQLVFDDVYHNRLTIAEVQIIPQSVFMSFWNYYHGKIDRGFSGNQLRSIFPEYLEYCADQEIRVLLRNRNKLTDEQCRVLDKRVEEIVEQHGRDFFDEGNDYPGTPQGKRRAFSMRHFHHFH